MNDSTDKHTPEAVEAFIERWTDTGGKERAKYQLFLTEPVPVAAGGRPSTHCTLDLTKLNPQVKNEAAQDT